MDSYGQKIDQFANGKEFIRLSKPLRDHAEASCDACGSTQPRTLFCLKDIGKVRYFFVGDNCLKELAKRGVIKRRFGKEATPVAYQKEMEFRSQESNNGPSIRRGSKDEIPGALAENPMPAVSIPSATKAKLPAHCAECYVIETKDEYHAFVSIKDSGSHRCYWGYAMEVKYVSILRRGGEGGLELDLINSEIPHALELSLSKAMEMAHSRLHASGQLPLIYGVQEMEEIREITEEPSLRLLAPTGITSI